MCIHFEAKIGLCSPFSSLTSKVLSLALLRQQPKKLGGVRETASPTFDEEKVNTFLRVKTFSILKPAFQRQNNYTF